jgi:hypothetical protein
MLALWVTYKLIVAWDLIFFKPLRFVENLSAKICDYLFHDYQPQELSH